MLELQACINKHLEQESLESMKGFDLHEVASFESQTRADVGEFCRAIAMATAIENLSIENLSNEAYHTAVESIFTTAEVAIPVSAVVPSFEASDALLIGHDGGAKAEKKKGVLKRIWEFIKGLWAKLKERLKGLFTRKQQVVTMLLTQQKEMEAAGSAMGYKFPALGQGHGKDAAAEKPAAGDDKQAPGGHAKAGRIGYSAKRTISLNVLGKDPSSCAHGADTLATHSKSMTAAVDKAFNKLLGLDFTKIPEGKDMADAVGAYSDKLNIPGGAEVEFHIHRTGAQVRFAGGTGTKFEVEDPSTIPVRELLHARAALVNAWDVNTKAMAAFGKHLDALEKIADQHSAKVQGLAEGAVEHETAIANGLQRACGFASRLLACPVEVALQPAIRELDNLLGA